MESQLYFDLRAQLYFFVTIVIFDVVPQHKLLTYTDIVLVLRGIGSYFCVMGNSRVHRGYIVGLVGFFLPCLFVSQKMIRLVGFTKSSDRS